MRDESGERSNFWRDGRYRQSGFHLIHDTFCNGPSCLIPEAELSADVTYPESGFLQRPVMSTHVSGELPHVAGLPFRERRGDHLKQKCHSLYRKLPRLQEVHGSFHC